MSWLLFLKSRAVQIGLLLALAVVGAGYLYTKIGRDAVSVDRAKSLNETMGKIKDAIKAERAANERNAGDGLYDDDGYKRD